MKFKFFALLTLVAIVQTKAAGHDSGCGNDPDSVRLLQSKTRIPSNNFVKRGTIKYQELNNPWQTKGNKTNPLVFVLARNEADVVATVKGAGKLGLRIVAKGGGHSFEKYSYGDENTVVIDLRLLDDVLLDPLSKAASVGSGLLLGPLGWKLWEAGKVLTPTAVCPTVGISGISLGGGHSTYRGRYGLSVDNILEMNVVTAKGKLLVVNKDKNNDLFWALRGGGASFGIVTKFVFQTYAAPEVVFRGTMTYEISKFSEVVYIWQKLQAELTSEDGVTLDLFINGTFFIVSFVDLTGSDTYFEKIKTQLPSTTVFSKNKFTFPDFLLYQAKSLSGELLREGVNLTAPSDLGKLTRYSTLPVYQNRKSFYIQKTFEQSDLSALQELYKEMPSSVLSGFEGYGGAVRHVAKNETAFVHRGDTLYNIFVSYKAHSPNNDAEYFVDKFFTFGQTHLGGKESYQNYLHEDYDDYLERYFGSNLPRLIEIKKKYDAENFFYFPQSIPTS